MPTCKECNRYIMSGRRCGPCAMEAQFGVPEDHMEETDGDE